MPHEQETAPGAAADEAEALKQERDELQDRLLRSAAEFDNYRKRTERERRELSDAVSADLIRDVLPVVDDLERALAAAADSPDKALRSGVELIHRQLLEAMRRRGADVRDVGEISIRRHEALASEPADGRRDGEITAEIAGAIASVNGSFVGDGEGGEGVKQRDYYEVLASPGAPAIRKSRAPIESWRCSTIRTGIPATTPRKKSSRKRPRRTRCSPIPTNACATTSSATPVSPAPRAGLRASTLTSSATSPTSSAISSGSAAANGAVVRRVDPISDSIWKSRSRNPSPASKRQSRSRAKNTATHARVRAPPQGRLARSARSAGLRSASLPAGFLVVAWTCGQCRGTGESSDAVRDLPRHRPRDEGTARHRQIPAGTLTVSARVHGEGEHGTGGGPTGDPTL